MALSVKTFTFNPFQENTYIIYNQNNNAAIVDPGCNSLEEKNILLSYIESEKLNIKYLINTHAHIDHILGNKFIYEHFNLLPLIHELDLYNFQYSKQASKAYGIHYDESPLPEEYLKENENIYLDNDAIKVILTPGHSSGSISLYSKDSGFIISGDTLFENSIGRVDLPGGDLNTLLYSIKNKILSLDSSTQVYPGHGNITTVAKEKSNNLFLK